MLEFIRRNRILLTSVLLLAFSVLLTSFNARSSQYSDPFARLFLDALEPLQSGLTSVGNRVLHVWRRYVYLVEAESDNRKMRERLEQLEQHAVRMSELQYSNRRLEELLRFRSRLHGAVYGARVIGRGPLPWSRTFTIDRGERDGVRRDMAVITAQGVVGKVVEVARSSSRVLLLTDHNSGIDAIVQRSRAHGIVQGAMDEGCHMKYVQRGEDIAVGDRIVTSGLDGVFPKGVLVGTVTDVSRRQRGLLQVAVIQPGAALEQVEEVLLVESTVRVEEGSP